jgi:predicted metalloendopeptidase
VADADADVGSRSRSRCCRCANVAESALRVWVETDVHSPPEARAIGPLMNRPEFGAAFQCPLGSVMNPTTKCQIW